MARRNFCRPPSRLSCPPEECPPVAFRGGANLCGIQWLIRTSSNTSPPRDQPPKLSWTLAISLSQPKTHQIVRWAPSHSSIKGNEDAVGETVSATAILKPSANGKPIPLPLALEISPLTNLLPP